MLRNEAYIDRAADRLLRAGDDLVDVLSPKLRSMRDDRDSLTARLQDADKRKNNRDTDATVKAAMAKLWTLQRDFKDAAPERLRELLQTAVSRIDLQYERKPQGKRMLTTLVSGTVELSHAVNRDDWIRTSDLCTPRVWGA